MSTNSRSAPPAGPGRPAGRPPLWRRPLRRILAAATVAATALAVAAGVAAGAAPASAATAAPHAARYATGPHNWIGIGWNVHLGFQADPSTTAHFFNTANSFGIGPNPGTSPVSDGFAMNGVLDYSSYAQFASDVSSGAIASSYHWVMYDPEAWSATPLNEQQDPAKYLALFGQLAHAHGYKVIETPARDLASVSGSSCPARPGESLDPWYVRCDIAGAAAAASDVYVLQDQVNTSNVAEFDQLFTQARSQALAANPSVAVDVELSTNYGPASAMVTAAESVSASGFFLLTTTGATTVADQFLQKMQAAGY
jgi:hypothetical protein